MTPSFHIALTDTHDSKLALLASVWMSTCAFAVSAHPTTSQTITSQTITSQTGVISSDIAEITAWEESMGEREFSGELIARPLQTLSRTERARALALIAQSRQRHVPLRHLAATDDFVFAVGVAPHAPGAAESKIARTLLATGLFQYVCPNWTVYPTVVPNDARFAEQWHHATMQSALAWDLHRGDASNEPIVAVTDTGIVAHEDLTNRVLGFNSASDLAEVNGGDLTDIHGHGTHVAGCAAARGNNNVGVAGVGWNFRIMPIRVSEAANGGASYENLLQGIQWAAENGAKVVSTSYSGIGYAPIETTGEYVRSLGASLLWAAGNSATNHASWDFEHVLVVGASSQSDQRASFSSFGIGVDLFAPGVAILSSTRDGGYQAWSGTSMATPVANGALALIRSANPALSPAHAEHVLLHSCDPWGLQRNDEAFGFGRINLARAIERALAAQSPQAPVAYDDVMRVVAGTQARIPVLANDWDANMDVLQVQSFSATTSAGHPVTRDGTNPNVLVVADLGLSAGVQTLSYTLEEPLSGATASATVSIEVVLPIAASHPSGTSAGLDAAYYEIPALTQLPDFSQQTPYLTEAVGDVNFASTEGAFAGSGRNDLVGAVFSGWLEVPTSGFWTLSTTSDDGSRLFLNGVLAVDNDGVHGMTTRSATLPLAAGKHAIRIEFFENGGGAGLQFRWSGPNTSTAAVPAANLSRGGTTEPADINRDGAVGSADLSLLLAAWGNLGGDEDVNGDGEVGSADLSVLLARWSS